MLAEVFRCLDAIDELLRLSQPCKASFMAREGIAVKFLRFDGTSDPLLCIYRCECYFHAWRTSESRRVAYAAFHLLDDAQLWYHHLPDNDGPPTWEQFVLLIAAQFRLQFTGKPPSTPTLGGDTVTQEGTTDNSVLFKVVGKGNGALPMDDDSGALRVDDDNNVLSGNDNTTISIIGAIGAGSSLDAGDVLVAISGSSAIGVISSSSGTNLSAGALCVGGEDNILSASNLGTGDRCLSGGNGALAAGKGSDMLHVGNSGIPTAGGTILSMGNCGDPDHIVIYNLLVPEAFTTASSPFCAHKESRWSFSLLPDTRRVNLDGTTH
jgi:hypothetical protein